MTKIPFLRTFAFTTTFASVICVLGGWFQSTNTAQVAGINLDDLRNTGYRIDWMNQSNSHNLHLPTVSNNSIYTIDENDYLTRYDLHSGQWRWSTPIGNQVYELRSINEFADKGLVYVVSDGAVYIVQSDSGNYPSNSNNKTTAYATGKKQLPLKLVANTPAISSGKFLIYGATSGDVVWFNPEIGFSSNRYKIGPSINVSPSVVEAAITASGRTQRAVVTGSRDGSVIAVDARNLSRLWSLKLLGAIECPVAYSIESPETIVGTIPRSSVFIAGSDQYLRAVDFISGLTRWEVLTTSKLRDSPVIHDNKVYQRIPNDGLACYEAFPHDISGKQNWLSSDISGNVITSTVSNRLVCWDQQTRILQIVEPRKGGIISSVSIPTAKKLISDNDIGGSLYIITDNDMLLRIVSRQ